MAPIWTRRDLLRSAAGGLLVGTIPVGVPPARSPQVPGDRPERAEGVSVLNPRRRVPVSLIIDDSTCLVNLAHFCIPQFAEVFPDQYRQPWRELPREIPDAFVRKFGEWCHEHGVKGKYSIVPYPACVGWVDRELPGWSHRELKSSLDLVRDLMMPDWDIHPEMVTHTWVIDTETGRPFPERTDRYMENWRWTDGKSSDELAGYLAYALGILKRAGLHCDGITTPGGFGNRVLPELSVAALEATRDVFGTEIPHYFRHLFTDERSVAPRVEQASGLDGPDPRCVVSIIGCTGDWFGGWDGLEAGSADLFITEDGKGGRLPEIIARGEPAIMVGHWPGFYFNGREVGFDIFRTVVGRIESTYPDLIWMKLGAIARYWAAKELTRIEPTADGLDLHAPYACPDFTIEVASNAEGPPSLVVAGEPTPLLQVEPASGLSGGRWTRIGGRLRACFDLPKGASTLSLSKLKA